MNLCQYYNAINKLSIDVQINVVLVLHWLVSFLQSDNVINTDIPSLRIFSMKETSYITGDCVRFRRKTDSAKRELSITDRCTRSSRKLCKLTKLCNHTAIQVPVVENHSIQISPHYY